MRDILNMQKLVSRHRPKKRMSIGRGKNYDEVEISIVQKWINGEIGKDAVIQLLPGRSYHSIRRKKGAMLGNRS